jgi:hypothetical protein
MKFNLIIQTTQNPWIFPARIPFFVFEGEAKLLNEEKIEKLKAKRQAWRPSQEALDLYELLKSNVEKTIRIRASDNDTNFDSLEDLPEPFIAVLKRVFTESVTDDGQEFKQMFLFLSEPKDKKGRLITDKSIHAILKPDRFDFYKLNFNTVKQLSIARDSLWKRLFKPKEF